MADNTEEMTIPVRNLPVVTEYKNTDQILIVNDNGIKIIPIEDLFGEYINELYNHLYKGRDLTVVFADEIADFEDEWAWIQDRINRDDFSGIRNRDYIPLTLSGGTGETHNMRLNIKTYTGTGDSGYEIPVCVDFISDDCYSETVQWNTSNNNNGNADDDAPYLVSNLYSFCSTLYSYLPAKVRSHIVQKRTLVEQRYSSGSTLTDSTARKWAYIGYCWVPSEVEVTGFTDVGTKLWSTGQGVQYPVFEGGWQNKIKGAGPGGERCTWWTITARGGASAYACSVGSTGNVNNYYASNSYRVPICFRIAAAA